MTLPKNPEEGDNINCPDCGESIVARLKTYKDDQYPAYVQWQNKKETVSHKTKDGDCKNIETISTQQEITTSSNKSESNIEPKKNHPDFLENSKKDSIKRKALLLWHIRCYVELTIKELEVNPNGGMIWEMTKIIYEELYGDDKN